MKIYTRTGDGGDTGLFGGGRVRKDDARVEAYGEVDELNASIGLAIAAIEDSPTAAWVERLRIVQEDLFAIGSHLATPDAESNPAAKNLPPLPIARVERFETWIDEAETRLDPLRNFVLPGGSEGAARLHLARTICRRAERRVLPLVRSADDRESVALVYLNRLSDLLFILARVANADVGLGDVPWRGSGREP